MTWDDVKRNIGEKAVELVPYEGLIGLGSGTTAEAFIRALQKRLILDKLSIRCIASSKTSFDLARSLELPCLHDSQWDEPISITFDGADYVDIEGCVIKGHGGAHLQEKILFYHSLSYVLMIDERKWRPKLLDVILPVEIVPFGMQMTESSIKEFGFPAYLRRTSTGKLFTTDNGNLLIDIHIPRKSILETERKIQAIPGVIETGLFQPTNCEVVLGTAQGKVSVYHYESK